MLKRTFAALLFLLTMAGHAEAAPSSSIADYQKTYDKAYPNQKIFDDANHPMPRSRNTSESSVLAPDNHSGKIFDGERPPVNLQAPPQQATEPQKGMMAGNPPTSTLLGLTELKYPMQKASHYGPPTPYEYYYLLFRYTPPPMVGNLDVGKCFGSQAAAQAAFKKAPSTLGIPITDSADYINKMTLNAKLVDQITSPSRWMKVSEAWAQAQQQDMANASAQAAEVAFAGALGDIQGDLFNVANERGARKPNMRSQTRTVEEVAWMVQEAYKKIFIPIALLLVLPGAVLTQVRTMVGYGFKLRVEAQSPFQGLLRAMIAIFLIPATQLIVSYAIDVGNCMTDVVASYGLDPKAIMNYANAELYDVPFKNASNQLAPQWENQLGRDPVLEDKVIFDLNAIWSDLFGFLVGIFNSVVNALFGTSDAASSLGLNPQGTPAVEKPNPLARGKATAAPEEESQLETQSRMTTQMQLGFNALNMVDCSVVTILLQFQTVMMCYLMLLGPIAAALYAWPSTAPFKSAFTSWVDGVVTLALWRFWWVMILLCMNVRIFWLADQGQYHINSEWEMVVFSAFTMLMSAVPFQPFDFKPGKFVQQILDKAEKDSKGRAENKVKAGNIGTGSSNTHGKAQSSGARSDGSDGERRRGNSLTVSQTPPPGKDNANGSAPQRTQPASAPPSSNPQPGTANSQPTAGASMAPVQSNATPPPLSKTPREA